MSSRFAGPGGQLRQHGAVPGSIRRQVRLVVDRASGQPVASPIRQSKHHLTLLWGLRFLCPVSVAKSSRAFSFIERNGPLNVGISDLGCFDFPAEVGCWQLSGAQFISGVSISGYVVATVNTSHDELFWNFSYIDEVVAPRSAERYADDCLRTVLRAIARR